MSVSKACEDAKTWDNLADCVNLIIELYGEGSEMYYTFLGATGGSHQGKKVTPGVIKKAGFPSGKITDFRTRVYATLGISKGNKFDAKKVKEALIRQYSARSGLARSDARPGGPRSPDREVQPSAAQIRQDVISLAKYAHESGVDAKSAAEQGELPVQYFDMLQQEMERLEQPVVPSVKRQRPPPPPRDAKGRPPPPSGRPSRRVGTDPRLPVTPTHFTSLKNLSVEAMLDLLINNMTTSDLKTAIERFVVNVPDLQDAQRQEARQDLEEVDAQLRRAVAEEESKIAADLEENTAKLQQLQIQEDQRMNEQLELVTNLRDLQASWSDLISIDSAETRTILNDLQAQYDRLSSSSGAASEFLTEAAGILRGLNSSQGFGKKYKKMNKKKFRKY